VFPRFSDEDHTGIEMVNGEPSDPGSETLVEPQLTPPIHGDEVAEPLVSKLVSYNVGHPVSVAVCRRRGIEEYCSSSEAVLVLLSGIAGLQALPVGDETPVLHGAV
jgi:hypothetical protein